MSYPLAFRTLASAFAGLALSMLAQAQILQRDALTVEERSTVDTIPLQSLGQEALGEAAIEGGLATTASGRPQPPRPQGEEFSAFTDPLAFTVDDGRAGRARVPLNVEINYQDPKSIPGIQFDPAYYIAPLPANRTYDYYDFNTTER